jgi:protein Mpv17
MELIRAYNRALIAKPLITKSVSSAALFIVGDLISQGLECRMMKKSLAQNYDAIRCFKLVLFGGLWVGPSLHLWYSRGLAVWFTKPGLQTTLKKTALDQTVFAAFSVFAFFGIQTLLSGGSSQDVKEKLDKEFWPTLKANWMLWPGAQLVNFGMVPVPYQVLFSNFVALFWNAYLSYVQYSSLRNTKVS